MDRLIEDLDRLISFKTVTGNKKDVSKLYSYVSSRLQKHGLKKKIVTSNGYESVVYATKSIMSPEITLQAHVDVVDGNEKLFKLSSKENLLLGRGVSDMKFSVAAYLAVVDNLAKKNLLSDSNIGIMLTSDEEVGGFDGVDYLLKEGFKSHIIFLPDGPDDDSGLQIVDEAKGILHCKITIFGKSSHGSTPWLGENAIEKGYFLFSQIKDTLEKNKNNSKWQNTVNFGKIVAGKAVNQVPDICNIFLDIRFAGSDSLESIRSKVNELVINSNSKYSELVSGESYKLKKDSDYVKSWIKSLSSRNIEDTYFKDYGSSDARFFVEKNIPVLMTKPKSGGMHSNNEWLDRKSLTEFTQVLTDWVIRL